MFLTKIDGKHRCGNGEAASLRGGATSKGTGRCHVDVEVVWLVCPRSRRPALVAAGLVTGASTSAARALQVEEKIWIDRALLNH